MSMNSSFPLRKIRGVVIVCCLILILGIFGYAYLTNIGNDIESKDEISSNLEAAGSEDLGYTHISSYLKKYGIGNINSYKINNIESYLEGVYYKELPEEKDLAVSMGLLFVEYFYDEVDLEDKDAVTDALLKCLFASIGDPYAYYRTAKEFDEYIGGLAGGDEFVGIGVLMSQEDLEIQMVYKESGAEAAGIKRGDKIYGVEDKTVLDTDTEELLNMIKGEPDTVVNVTVKRGEELITFAVVRKTLSERTVLYDMDDDKVGNIQIYQFLQTTVDEFKEAVDYCVQNGAVALVIDVRSNPGGLLNSVVSVIDYLVPDAEGRRIGSYSERNTEHVFYTTDGHSVDLPIAVICDGNTASAGELFTAAMRDYGKEGVMNTVIVGSNTYGKGVAQNSYTLYDNSGITFTIGYFNPPSDVNFDGVGILPDVEVAEVAGKDAPFDTAKNLALEMVNTNSGTSIDYGAAA